MIWLKSRSDIEVDLVVFGANDLHEVVDDDELGVWREVGRLLLDLDLLALRLDKIINNR